MGHRTNSFSGGVGQFAEWDLDGKVWEVGRKGRENENFVGYAPAVRRYPHRRKLIYLAKRNDSYIWEDGVGQRRLHQY